MLVAACAQADGEVYRKENDASIKAPRPPHHSIGIGVAWRGIVLVEVSSPPKQDLVSPKLERYQVLL